ncbi:MAG: SpoVG family protein [Candidatus Omnitrophica bacterium]|nr:SpoVG family protein [Candidatus Omnitrophota bacterium]
MKEKIKIRRLYKLEGNTNLKAFVDVSIGGLFIRGMRILEGTNGLFLGMPRYQAKNGRFYNIIYLEDKELKDALTHMILEAYQD